MKPADQVAELMEMIAQSGTYGSRSEWLDHFESTRATNCPALMFADAIRHQLLVEAEPDVFSFVGTWPGREDDE